MPKFNFILKFLTHCLDTPSVQRDHSWLNFIVAKIWWKRLGFSFKEAICARVTVCGREKINHFQKPYCSRIRSKATIVRAKYSTWQYQAMEKHKGNLSNWPGQKVYSSIIFHDSFLRVWFRRDYITSRDYLGFKQVETETRMGNHVHFSSLILSFIVWSWRGYFL